jgi:hypothetical protein
VTTRGRKGRLEKTVTVNSNDPVTPNLVLKIAGSVVVVAGFEPDRLDLRNILKGSEQSQTVKVVAKDPQALKLSEITSSAPEQVTAELGEEQGQKILKVKIKAGETAGRLSARITAKTNLEAPKEVQLFVYGNISNDLVVDRNFVFFSGTVEQKPQAVLERVHAALLEPLVNPKNTTLLKVTSLGEKPFEVKGVEDPSGTVLGVARRVDQEWQVLLTVYQTPSAPRGMVKILTDRPDQATIEVNYSTRNPGPAAGTVRPMLEKLQPGTLPGQKPGLPGGPLQLAPKANVLPSRFPPQQEPVVPPKAANP